MREREREREREWRLKVGNRLHISNMVVNNSIVRDMTSPS